MPVVYLWNEVYGIGNHAAYIKYGNCGCYECFLTGMKKQENYMTKHRTA